MDATTLTYEEGDGFAKKWRRHIKLTERDEDCHINLFNLSDYVIVNVDAADSRGTVSRVYDKKTLQHHYNVGDANSMRCLINIMDNMFIFIDRDDNYKLYHVGPTRVIVYEILGMKALKMHIFKHFGFGIFQLMNSSVTGFYLAELTKIIFPNGDIAYAFTNITRTKHDVAQLLDVRALETSNCEIVARTKDNTLLIYKSTSCKELAVDSMEKLLEFATFKPDIPLISEYISVEEYDIFKPLQTPAATIPNVKEIYLMTGSNFNERETILIDVIDGSRGCVAPRIIDNVDTNSLSVGNIILQIDAETLTVMNGITDIRHDAIALTNDLCVSNVSRGNHFAIYKRAEGNRLEMMKYYAHSNMRCIATTPNRICFMTRNGKLTFLKMN
jgi:hypothetical protein